MCILYKEILLLKHKCALVGCNKNKDSALSLVSPIDQLRGHESVHNSATICNTVIISSIYELKLRTSYTLFKD